MNTEKISIIPAIDLIKFEVSDMPQWSTDKFSINPLNYKVVDLHNNELLSYLIENETEIAICYQNIFTIGISRCDNYVKFKYVDRYYYLNQEYIQDEKISILQPNDQLYQVIKYPIYIGKIVANSDDHVICVDKYTHNKYYLDKYPYKYALKKAYLIYNEL